MKAGNGLVQSNSTAAVASKLMTIRFRIDMSRLCVHHSYWLYLHHGLNKDQISHGWSVTRNDG
uniref:Uncharacterized protein n=1 Tax=Helianthus annuus TaxID=4232 RepID=A0A251UVT5_HELAN